MIYVYDVVSHNRETARSVATNVPTNFQKTGAIMYTEESRLILSVCANPQDEAPRLTMAAYWESVGNIERARFIHIQWLISQLRDDGTKSREIQELHKKEWELLRSHPTGPLPSYRSIWFEMNYPFSFGYTLSVGFMESVTMDLAKWNKHHASLFYHPDQQREFTNELSVTVQPITLLRLVSPSPDFGIEERFSKRPGAKLVSSHDRGNKWTCDEWPGLVIQMPDD